ncbi:helix-turn-helix transcriptional regulator [Agrobacterium sp.]|uniref:helix-turn-helix transcriptional regulator n=1 Tax=Agrobacterium sp. TaxID=361 RepID=UPI0028A6EE45|nr:LuxR C-terminal-related transcriptional regulator [Agrobacterium sp.]
MSEIHHDIVSQIYAAGLLPELWPSVIDSLSDQVRGRGGSLFILADGQLTWDAPQATKTIMEEYVAGGWGERNVRLERLLAKSDPEFVLDTDFFDEEEIRTLPIFQDFLLPRDIAFTAATVIKGSGDDIAVFSVDRRMAEGRFVDRELAFLNGVRPHLGRAVALAGRLKMKQTMTAMATLQLLGIPAAVLSHASKVIATNSSFDLLAGQMFLPAAFGRLALFDKQADRLLRQSLDGHSLQQRSVRSIPVRSESKTPVGILHVIPACMQAQDIIGAGGTLLILARPVGNVSLNAEWLKGLYDLSPTEAKIAAHLSEGRSLDKIASQTGTAKETVRTHVKHLLQKTGFARQIDFVRAAGSLAVIQPQLCAGNGVDISETTSLSTV